MTTIEQTIPQTPKQAYGAMLGMIRATHWTQDSLACPVFQTKRLRVPDSRNPSGYAYRTVLDYTKPPIKHVYCLVGLLLKVLGMEVNGEALEWNRIEERAQRTGLHDEDYFLRKIATSKELLQGLFDELAEEDRRVWNPRTMRYEPVTDPSQKVMITKLENWNDDNARTKADVEDLIERAFNAAA